MNKQPSIGKRIEELESAARQARLEAMRLAATIVSRSDSLLVGAVDTAQREAELAALKVRYDGLVRLAEDVQVAIDKLQAEEHSLKYDR